MRKKQVMLLLTIVLKMNVLLTFGQGTAGVSAEDFKRFKGMWKGTLTYIDYSSNKPYTMPADVDIRQLGTSGTFIFSNTYPDEPKANSADTLTISENGKMLNTALVKSKRKRNDETFELVTELLSIDGNDNKPAIIRHTYVISANKYKNVKEVQFIGQNQWIKRSEYSYMRK